MIRGVKGELKVRDIDITKLKGRAIRDSSIEARPKIKAIEAGSFTPQTRRGKSIGSYKPDMSRRSRLGNEQSVENPSQSTIENSELPPISDTKRSPNLYQLRRKKKSLHSRNLVGGRVTSPESNSGDFSQYRSEHNSHLSATIKRTGRQRKVSPTFKTQPEAK